MSSGSHFFCYCCLFLELADLLASVLASAPPVVLLFPKFWLPKSLVFQLDSLPLWLCTAVCCLKAVRPDSHFHSGSTNLHTHLRVLFFFRSVGRRIWIQRGSRREPSPPHGAACYATPLVLSQLAASSVILLHGKPGAKRQLGFIAAVCGALGLLAAPAGPPADPRGAGDEGSTCLQFLLWSCWKT